jgi:8-oxo-dGTP diphosphatase
MEPITNKRGTTLLEFIPSANEESTKAILYSPFVASCVVAVHNGAILLVYDRFKQHWELPGGGIETGETPRDCAVRELMEESGQSGAELEFAGIIKFKLAKSGIRFAAIYSCSLPELSPFQPNDEIGKNTCWDFISDIGYIDEISEYITKTVLNNRTA